MSPLAITEVAMHCNSWHEAQRIADHLFGKQLITSAETVGLGAQSQQFDAAANGVQLLIQSTEEFLERITREVQDLLGHDVAISRTGTAAKSH